MSEAILGVVFEKLQSLLLNEFATISGVKSTAENLSTTLDLINAVLHDAEQKQLTDRSIKVWLQQLKDAVYVLDDILDECSIQSRRLTGYLNPKNIMFRRVIGNRLKKISNRLDLIAESKKKFLLRDGVSVPEREFEVVEWRQTSSIIAEPKVYGREDDKEKIVEFLVAEASGHDSLSVYPIVGLGGAGKTTLAQLVYNDQKVSSNFDAKVWVCVSENFSVKRILCSIIESIKREKCDVLDLDVIERKVRELLQGKKYLLILDDVWKRNEEFEFGISQDKWNKLKSVLSCGSKGASVLVSTRDKDVAAIMGTCEPHHLSGLTQDDCWLLFKQYAFGPDTEEQEELVAIGKEIVKKCGGLPLAAKALGGLMHSRRGEHEWREIEDSPLWTLPDNNAILPSLRLSYFHLTPTLKQCFGFCAMFPKDTKIMKQDLIHLWMGNGFISSRVNLEVEDVGNMIWNELCQKSFFQDIKVDDYSGDISFKMHDLVHDLAQSVTGQECMILENTNTTHLSRSTHHISVEHIQLSINKGAFKHVESLRTLYQLKCSWETFSCSYLIPTNLSIRVLCIAASKMSSLGSFIHLRYLELHGYCTHTKTIPDSIYNLQKLEILKLLNFSDLRGLPEHLTCLQNLRHLIVEGCSLSRMFPNIGKLSCLRTLSVFIVKRKRGHSLAELQDLKLGGKLSIEGLNNVSSLSEARQANLIGKKDLHELHLSWNNSGKTKTLSIGVEQVLDVLQPHSNLKILTINNYDGLCCPSWFRTLSSLVSLALYRCNCMQLSSLGKLPSLKQLYIFKMDFVQYLDEADDSVDVGAFPSLEKLTLELSPNLEQLLKVERREMFLRLSKLTIWDCPKLVLPCLPSIYSLDVDVCNNQLLRSISGLYGLTTLRLGGGYEITSFPEGMFRSITCMRFLTISSFPKLKELPNEPFNPGLERLEIYFCDELESLPEKIWEGPRSLRSIHITGCERLRSLPECTRHLTSLEALTIDGCPTLEKRCKEGTGEDWDKIAHIPKLKIGL